MWPSAFPFLPPPLPVPPPLPPQFPATPPFHLPPPPLPRPCPPPTPPHDPRATAAALRARLCQAGQQHSAAPFHTKSARWAVGLPALKARLQASARQVVAAAERVSQIRQEAPGMDERAWDDAMREMMRLQADCTADVSQLANSPAIPEASRKLSVIRRRRTRLRRRRAARQVAADKWAARQASIAQEAEAWRRERRAEERRLREEEAARARLRRRTKALCRRERLAAEVGEKLEAVCLLRGLRRMEAENEGQLFPASVEEEVATEVERLRALLDGVREEQQREREEVEKEMSPLLSPKKKKRKEEVRGEETGNARVEEMLFGEAAELGDPEVRDFLSQGTKDWDKFVDIRRAWDRFLCAPDLPGASAVPPGWVLPDEPSSEEWQRLLQPKVGEADEEAKAMCE